MQWSGHFDWAANEFQFVEIFAGAGHTSHQWSGPYQYNSYPCLQFLFSRSFLAKETSWIQCGSLRHRVWSEYKNECPWFPPTRWFLVMFSGIYTCMPASIQVMHLQNSYMMFFGMANGWGWLCSVCSNFRRGALHFSHRTAGPGALHLVVPVGGMESMLWE